MHYKEQNLEYSPKSTPGLAMWTQGRIWAQLIDIMQTWDCTGSQPSMIMLPGPDNAYLVTRLYQTGIDNADDGTQQN